MIIDLTTYTKNQDSQIEKYFTRRRPKTSNLFDFLPSCLKDFIEKHTGIYILIEKILNRKDLRSPHLAVAKKMIQNSREIYIHLPKSENTSTYFQKLMEKAEYTEISVAQELTETIHSLKCGLLDVSNKSAFQRFKKCWTSFINYLLNEMINEISITS